MTQEEIDEIQWKSLSLWRKKQLWEEREDERISNLKRDMRLPGNPE